MSDKTSAFWAAFGKGALKFAAWCFTHREDLAAAYAAVEKLKK